MRTNMMGMLLGVALACTTAAGQNDRYTGEGWSFQPPEGWVELGPEHLDAMNAVLRSIVGSDSQSYIAGFADPTLLLEGEYVMVQLNDNPFSGIGEQELIDAFGAFKGSDLSDRVNRGADGIVDLNVEAMRMGDVVYDEARRRVVMRMQSTIDGQPQEGYSVLYPGNNRGIQLNWYAPAAEFEASLPTFVASTDTFAWDRGEAWTPAIGMGKRMMLFAAIGALLGGFAPLVMAFAKKRAEAEQDPASDA